MQPVTKVTRDIHKSIVCDGLMEIPTPTVRHLLEYAPTVKTDIIK